MDHLSGLIQSAKPILLRAGAVSSISSLLWIVQASAIAFGFAGLLQQPTDGLTPMVAAAVFCAIGLLRAGLDLLAGKLAFDAADQLIGEQRKQLVITESLRSNLDIKQPASASIAALAAEKIGALQPYLLRYWPARMRVLVVPLTIIVIVIPISWVVAIILLIAGPLIPVFMALVGVAARDASKRQMSEIGTLNALLMDRLSALVDIRLLDASTRSIDQFQQAADTLRSRTMEVLKIAFLSSTVLELFSAIGVAMVAVYVGFSLLGEIRFGAYNNPLTIAQGMLLLLLAPDFFQPLRDLATAWHDKAAADAVADELASLRQSSPISILGTGSTAARLPNPTSLRTSALCFETPHNQRLQFPDIQVDSGATLAIVGPSGSGKSTLLSLLAGLTKPASGSITVAGEPLNEQNADAWRAGIGWVSQSPHFLSSSLRSNIALGGDVQDLIGMRNALDVASATPIIDNLPSGLNTRVGETGVGISGGEARRLILARAAFAHPATIFADEPTADLDTETAREVSDGLLALAENGAMLIVATHDLALADRMQQVVTLEGLL